MSKHNLEIGQTVFLEVTGSWINYGVKKERSIKPADIVDMNKTSFYIITHGTMERHSDWQEKKHLRDRINIKTLTGKSSFDHYKVWLSEEDFHNSVKAQKERTEILHQAQIKFSDLKFEEKKRFLEEF